MNRTIFFITFFLSYLFIIQFSLSQESNIKIIIGRFAPSLNLQVSQGGSGTLNFFIQNTYNESLTIFYRIEKPSGVEIQEYPSKYYMLNPNTEIVGNLKFSIDPYLENRSYTVRFWIDSFTEFANKTIQSNKVSINLTVLSNSSISSTTTVTTETTTTQTPIETSTIVFTTEIPTTIQPNEDNNESLSYKEYLMIFGVIVLFLLLPLLMLRKSSTKETTSTSSQEEVQAKLQ
jgi:hypothetical protein